MSETHTCPVCYNTYDGVDYIPMIAGSCGHSICENCLNKMRTLNKDGCPQHAPLVPGTKEKWHKNFLAIELLRSINEQKLLLEQQEINVSEMWSTGKTVIPGVTQDYLKATPQSPIAKTPISPALNNVDNISAKLDDINLKKNVQVAQTPINHHNPMNPRIINPANPVNPFYDAPPAFGIERNTIFISNLNRSMTKLQIYKAFREHGKIVRYGFGNEENVNKGYMEMEYEQDFEAANAIRSMNGKPLGPDNQPIKVVYKKRLNQGPPNQLPMNQPPPPFVKNVPVAPKPVHQPHLNPSAAVYIDNLGPITKDALMNIFAQDGPIVDVKMGTDARGNFNGTATVFYAFPHCVANALKRDGQPQPGYGAKMTVEEYKPNNL